MKPLKSRKTILRVAVPDDLGCDLRLQAVPGEGLLQDVGGGRRVRAFAQVYVRPHDGREVREAGVCSRDHLADDLVVGHGRLAAN